MGSNDGSGGGGGGSGGNVVTFKGQRCGGHSGTVRAICFSPLSPDTLLSAGAGDCVARVWDVTRGALRCTLSPVASGGGKAGGGGASTIYSCVLADDGCTALTAGADAVLRLWDIRSGRCERAIPGAERSAVHCVSLSPSAATTAATASESGAVSAWDLSSGRRMWTLHPHAVGAQCRSVDYSPCGRWILSASFDGSVAVTDASAWERRVVASFLEHGGKALQARWSPAAAARPAGGKTRSPAPGLFASCSSDKTVKLWA